MAALVLVALLTALMTRPPALAGERPGNVDTEDLFGFVQGGDIGERGEKEFEGAADGRFGRGQGTYGVVANTFEFKYSITDAFRISATPTLAYYDIAGVSGPGNLLDDRRQGAMQALSFDTRFRLLDRNRAPFGLTVSIAPEWGFTDETTGAPAQRFGADLLLIADRALVPDWLFGALNLTFEPESTRLAATGATARESTLGAGAALALQIKPGVFIGGEGRYLARYRGLALDTFAGEAFLLGPTLSISLNNRTQIGAVWDFQVWGSTGGIPGALNLIDFERHQVKVRLIMAF